MKTAIDSAAAIQAEIRAAFRDLGSLLVKTAGATSDPEMLAKMHAEIMVAFDVDMATTRRRLQERFNELSVAVSK